MATTLTHSFDRDAVTVSLVTDDTRHVMTGIAVNNTSSLAIRLEIPGGRGFTVNGRVSTTVATLQSDERDIQQRSDGAYRGRPYRVAYPWFG